MGEEIVKEMLKHVKRAIKAALIPILIPILCIVLVIVLLAASVYFITVDDGTYKEDDWSNPMFGASQYTNSVTVGEDGMLSSDYTAQELWDKLKEKNSRVVTYLKDAKELAKLMNAEVITQYPDTRANPDTKINWSTILNPEKQSMQGIIKFKRNIIDGNYNLTEKMLQEFKKEYEEYLKEEADKKQKEEEKKDKAQKIAEANKEVFEYTVKKNENGGYIIGKSANIQNTPFDDVFKKYIESGEKITIKWVGAEKIQVGTETFYKPEYNLDFSRVEDLVYKVEGQRKYKLKISKNQDGSYKLGDITIGKDNVFCTYQFPKIADGKEVLIAVDENKTFTIGTAKIAQGEVNYKEAKEIYEKVRVFFSTKDNKQENNNQDNGKEVTDEEDNGSGFENWLTEKGYVKDMNSGNWKKNSKNITMTYAKPEEFRKYIQEYKNTGSQEAKEKALSHFTIEKNTASSSSGAAKVGSLDNFLFIGDSITVGLSGAELNDTNKQALSSAKYKAEIGKSANYWLQHFSELPDAGQVKGVCVLLGVNNPSDTSSMKQLIDKLVEKYSNTNIYIQRVFPVGQAYGYPGLTAETMNESISSYNSNIKQYCEGKDKVYYIDTTDGYIDSNGYLKADMSAGDGLHLSKYDKMVENISSQIVGASNNSEKKDNDKKENKNDKDKNNDKNSTSANLDVDPDINSEPYSNAQLNPFISVGSWGQCTWFAWGKFYEIYGYDPGFRGNGCTNADELISHHRR